MIQFPNCKINLGLNITAKRSDGFHELETIFYPVPFTDILEIVPATDDCFEFTFSGLPIPGEETANLCIKAVDMLRKEVDFPQIHMHIHKIIPMGSGLGGGSSDGAFTLKMIKEMFDINVTTEKLNRMAASLGSDCPYFLMNHPASATGKGEILESTPVNLAGLYLAIVIPDLHVSTSFAYSKLTPKTPQRPLKERIMQPLESWKDHIFNDFENIIFAIHPEIKIIKDTMYEEGALFASMSGSGSAVYGLYSDPPQFLNRFADCFTWLTRLPALTI